MIRLAVTVSVQRILNGLLDDTGQEQGAFCLIRQGRGHDGVRFLVTEAVLPPPGAWERQGIDVLRPSAQWISSMVSCAIEARAGLLFVHTHPEPSYPLGFSIADDHAFRSLADTLAPMLEGPFSAVVVHPHGWAGVTWLDGQVVPIDRIVSVGRTLEFLSPIDVQRPSELDSRQRDGLGVVHDRVRQLTIAVAGVGGIGSPTAEQVVRMGVEKVITVDRDKLDSPSNLRRVFGAKMRHIRGGKRPAKVDIVGGHLDEFELSTVVKRIEADVRTERGFRHLLDADVVLAATDTHGSRAILNDLASTYLVPVIDVGVRVGNRRRGRLSGLVAEVRILTPTTPCMWCRGVIDSDTIRLENLPALERKKLIREGYVADGFGDPEPSVIALTVLGSGLATCALLSLLSEDADVAPSGYWFDGFLGDAMITTPEGPLSSCRCRTQLGLGDGAPPPFIADY